MKPSMRTRPPGPAWYFECRVCHEEVEPDDAANGICSNCGVGGSVVRLPQGKAGRHIPRGFAKGEEFDRDDPV